MHWLLPVPNGHHHGLCCVLQALFVAGAIAFQYVVEFFPIDRSKSVVPCFFVPLKLLIWDGESKEFGLWNGLVYEFLPEFIIGFALDLPVHALSRIGGLLIRWAEHHQGWPPPAVERILSHFLLLLGSLAQGKHDLVSLTLMEAFLFAYPNHGART